MVLLAPKNVFQDNIPGYFPLAEEGLQLSIHDPSGEGIGNVSSVKLENLSIEVEESNDEFRISLFSGALKLFEKYLQLYSATPAFLEVFQDTQTILSQVKDEDWHTDIKVKMENWNNVKQKA